MNSKHREVIMKGQSKCEVCGVVFEWYRGPGRNVPRFCTHKCRLKVGTGFRPGGQLFISEMTKEQKFQRLKKSFEKHVIRQEGCWSWKGPVAKGGYPVMSCNRKLGPDRGHQASWLIHNKDSSMIYEGKLKKGMHVCHSCDNPICTNPDHLWIGTHQQNNDDKMRKGRFVFNPPPVKKGSENAAAKLNEDKVKEIKIRAAKGDSTYSIAQDFNVSRKTINCIKSGKNWFHVTIDTNIGE